MKTKKTEDETKKAKNSISRKEAIKEIFIFSTTATMTILSSGTNAAEASPYSSPPYLPPDHGN